MTTVSQTSKGIVKISHVVNAMLDVIISKCYIVENTNNVPNWHYVWVLGMRNPSHNVSDLLDVENSVFS